MRTILVFLAFTKQDTVYHKVVPLEHNRASGAIRITIGCGFNGRMRWIKS